MGREAGDALAPGAADPDQQRVAMGLLQNARQARHVLQHVLEHYEVHLVLLRSVVVLEVQTKHNN